MREKVKRRWFKIGKGGLFRGKGRRRKLVKKQKFISKPPFILRMKSIRPFKTKLCDTFRLMDKVGV